MARRAVGFGPAPGRPGEAVTGERIVGPAWQAQPRDVPTATASSLADRVDVVFAAPRLDAQLVERVDFASSLAGSKAGASAGTRVRSRGSSSAVSGRPAGGSAPVGAVADLLDVGRAGDRPLRRATQPDRERELPDRQPSGRVEPWQH